jgi:predicted RNA-binding protein
MTTHVFIVDSNTFNIHLKHLFAGTGAKDNVIDFNNSTTTSYNSTTENMLVSMSADATRLRHGDKIIFYLQQSSSDKITEGKFFGIFEATDNWSFLDNNDGDQYLFGTELKKSLFYRTLIKPDKVYADGVTEWEALDEIKNIQSPNQMLWSLIYRKLKGNRGNTMLTIYESEKLCQLIRNKNNRTELHACNNQLLFDKNTQKIIVDGVPRTNYTGRKAEINVLPRLIQKYNDNKAFEAHLQSYIIKNIGLGINNSLDNFILDQNNKIEWLGNEVSCGVGMQRIDIALSVNANNQRIFIAIELKAVEISLDNIRQISRYIDWIEQYYIPNRQSDILPVVVARKFDRSTAIKQQKYDQIMTAFHNFNSNNTIRCHSVKYIEYEAVDNNLVFYKVDY